MIDELSAFVVHAGPLSLLVVPSVSSASANGQSRHPDLCPAQHARGFRHAAVWSQARPYAKSVFPDSEGEMEDPQYAINQLQSALQHLATSADTPQAKLQHVWDHNVQMLWERKYLADATNEQFKALWSDYTAKSDNLRSTVLRELTSEEYDAAVRELLSSLTNAVADKTSANR